MSKLSVTDIKHLRRTLALAGRGRGWANPNPMVGSVIVKNGKVLGEGYFRGIGFPHAEVEAIKAAKNKVRGATLYVNIEPHSFHGRTPPCTKAIIQSGIKRVVSFGKDPNPRVNGQGFAVLRRKGVKIRLGGPILEAKMLNEAYYSFFKNNRPFIALKWAQSLDGKIATRASDSKWISNNLSRNYARRLRGQYQAILVGSNTVLNDDPHLGAGGTAAKDPVRIILDSKLSLPLKSKVLRDKNLIIATTGKADKRKKLWLIKNGFQILTFASKHIAFKQLMRKLRKLNIISILVEGGGEVHGSFVDSKLFDKVYIFIAPIIVGGKEAVSSVGGLGSKTVASAPVLRNIKTKKFGDNLFIEAYAHSI